MSRPPSTAGRRRRLYLMRHGEVCYFDAASGRPVLPEQVSLTAHGRAQADAAGAYLREQGVRLDRAIISGLPRTAQTAALVLQASGHEALRPEVWPAWEEIRGGRLSALAPSGLRQAFCGLHQGQVPEAQRFLGGESVGELLDRVLPALQRLRADPHWDSALLVLHGVVNAALLSHALSGGQRLLYGSLMQSPACLNVLDVGEAPGDWVLRALNIAPLDGLRHEDRLTTMEHLLDQYLHYLDFRQGRPAQEKERS
ncbi:histidine phosphatase family protein [Mitsuaria sp. WAJ17]|uniref:histidine phosphatase family protein n=1 Tax=Mitsuaria sp. WAJ17 TaxID=2761452 RepID=UPI0015FF2609|nr:histidine phosphatase family protein [Mitsuaria sp. WAJ17]MBB2487717.1 histidine phosphatase family protein [Mitsuaria sp. WAJ17]